MSEYSIKFGPTWELRRRLDELDIEYTIDDSNDYEIVEWQGPYNLWWQFVYDPYDEEPYGELRLLNTGGSTHLTPEQAVAATVGPKVTEDTSDGWHSFKDLYHHRALLFSVIVHNYKDMCWKSKRHDDGKELDWNFIVGIDTPWGQASYHYGMEYWDMFDCKVLDKAPHYDGYTPEQSVERIARLVELDAATVGAGTCHMEVKDNLDENEGMGDVWLECDECHWQMSLEPTTPRFNYCPNCRRRVVSDR